MSAIALRRGFSKVVANRGAKGIAGGRAVSVRALHFTQLLTGFPAFHAHGSNSSRRLTGCPAIMRESTSWR